MRLSQPIRAVPLRIQASSAWAGTALWREEDRLGGVDAAGDQRRGHFADARAQLRRVDVDGQRMQVGEEEQALGLVLHPHPAQDRAEQIAEVKVASRLNARDDAHRRRSSSGIGIGPPAPRAASAALPCRCRRASRPAGNRPPCRRRPARRRRPGDGRPIRRTSRRGHADDDHSAATIAAPAISWRTMREASQPSIRKCPRR